MVTDDQLAILVAAAGKGNRMGSALPKQHLALAGSTVLGCTLSRMQQFVSQHCPQAHLFLLLAADDPQAASLARDFPAWQQVKGGSERWLSVLSGLQAICTQLASPWVMVHDAARPLVQVSDVARLWQHCQQEQRGALLAKPVVDTIKCLKSRSQHTGAGEQPVTLDRSQLWAALTPQCFRAQPLLAALQQALAQGLAVTDEASAMELSGHEMDLIDSHADNFKITTSSDLSYARWLMEQQS